MRFIELPWAGVTWGGGAALLCAFADANRSFELHLAYRASRVELLLTHGQAAYVLAIDVSPLNGWVQRGKLRIARDRWGRTRLRSPPSAQPAAGEPVLGFPLTHLL
jgi:hypothetical protein